MASARATLRAAQAIFANAVGAGSLETTPTGVLQATALGTKKTPRGSLPERGGAGGALRGHRFRFYNATG